MSKQIENPALYGSIKQLIEESKQLVAVAVNAPITTLYWQIGKLINEEILKHTRTGYGKQIVATLSLQFTAEYGKAGAKSNYVIVSILLKLFLMSELSTHCVDN